MIKEEEIRLTRYSHGAGCGCKISPTILDEILRSTQSFPTDPRLLVGNEKRDDAAVLDMGNGTALISTTDFFMPIVDDPFDFGRIASANAISDVYAMGGKPILAIAILGWPISLLPPEVAQKVLEGARTVCAEAGITLAGGHSIDCPEPVFGLAVNGIVSVSHLKRNATAEAGCRLYLTKSLGVGILSTARKQGVLLPDDAAIALESMVKLNSLGEKFGKLSQVKAMTDVTGFGLLGHLMEICDGSELSATIEYKKIPVIPSLSGYLSAGCIPGGTQRNWGSYGHKVSALSDDWKDVLADPQTSGGLLVAVSEDGVDQFEEILKQEGLSKIHCHSFGQLNKRNGGPVVRVI